MRLTSGCAVALAAVLLAGCLDAGDDDAPGVTRHATSPDMPEPTDVDAACVDVDVTAEPSTIRPGEDVALTAGLTNACADAIVVQGTSGSCSPRAMEAAVLFEGTRWHVGDGGAAFDLPGCTDDMPDAFTVDPGATLHASWTWNGTFVREGCDGELCHERFPAPPGEYEVTAWLIPERHNVTGSTRMTVTDAEDEGERGA